MTKPKKSYVEYVHLVNAYNAFVVALNAAGLKARERFQLEERVRVLLIRNHSPKKKTVYRQNKTIKE